jgi:hypothetical protein
MSTQPEVRKDAILSREPRVFPSRALSDACEKLINKDVRRRPFLAQKHIDPPARGRIWIVLHCHPSASVTRARPIPSGAAPITKGSATDTKIDRRPAGRRAQTSGNCWRAVSHDPIQGAVCACLNGQPAESLPVGPASELVVWSRDRRWCTYVVGPCTIVYVCSAPRAAVRYVLPRHVYIFFESAYSVYFVELN